MTSGPARTPVLLVLFAVAVGVVSVGGWTLLAGLSNTGISPETPVAVAKTRSTMVDEVVQRMNEQRGRAGCDPLRVDPRLATAAEAHSTDMAERRYFDHTTPEGLTFRDRIMNAGYANPGTGENIAQGQPDAEHVMASWMASEGHRANIVNCDFALVGVGLDEDGMYWTQDFGKI